MGVAEMAPVDLGKGQKGIIRHPQHWEQIEAGWAWRARFPVRPQSEHFAIGNRYDRCWPAAMVESTVSTSPGHSRLSLA